MGDFVFTDPEGRKYYASGDTAADAFPRAEPISESDIAQLTAEREYASPQAQMGRMTQEWEDVQRRRDPAKEAIDLAGETAKMAIPGVGPAFSLARGDYGEAAEEAAFQALPAARFLPRAVVKPALAAASGALGLTGGAVAADEWDFIPDPKEREAAKITYSKIRGEDPVDRSDKRRQYITDLRKQYGEKAEKKEAERRRLAAEEGAVEKFNQTNKALIDSLTDDQKGQLNNAVIPGDTDATLQAKGAILSKISQERERSTMGFSERNPEAMEWIQKGSYLLSAGIPIGSLYLRAGTLKKAAHEAEAAYIAATRAKGAKKPAAEAELALRRDQLEAAHANRGVGLGTVALAPTLPLAAAEAPNLIDLAQLQSHPESPAYKHAWEMVNPWATDKPWYDSPAFHTGVRALEEGAQATAAGLALGEPTALLRQGHAGRTGGGTLQTIRAREQSIADDLAKREAAKTRRQADLAAEKAAREQKLEAEEAKQEAMRAQRKTERGTRAASKAEATQRAADEQRIAGADQLKRKYAETAAAAEQAERELRAAIQQAQGEQQSLKQGGSLAPGGGAPDVLQPGGKMAK